MGELGHRRHFVTPVKIVLVVVLVFVIGILRTF